MEASLAELQQRLNYDEEAAAHRGSIYAVEVRAGQKMAVLLDFNPGQVGLM